MVRVAILLTIAGSPALAQAILGLGSLGGTVSDSTGAAIANVKIHLTDVFKGSTRETESSEGGSFLIPSLNAGVYVLLVEKEGFLTERIGALKIDVGERAFVTMTLGLGPERTSVSVVAPGPVELASQSNSLGSLVGAEQVRQLPLNGRNFLQLALLDGTTKELAAVNDVFSSNIGAPGRLVVLPGAFPYASAYSLNGINVRGSRDGELVVSPSVAAVEEFKVETGFLMPDQGTGQAVVNVVTKSGTNEFHGETYWFLRNTVLDARSFFARSRENLRRNQFGVSAGAPLIRNRAWVAGFYEGLRDRTAVAASGFAPTVEMFAGNFASTGRPIHDPASYNPDTRTRALFPGGTIPSGRISPVARNLLAYYRPGSSLADRPNNIFGQPRNELRDDQGGLRLDAQISRRSQLFGQFLHQKMPSAQSGLFPLSGLQYENEATLAMLQHSWALNANATNTLRAGFLRSVAVGRNEASGLGPLLDGIGIANTFDRNGVSAINLQGYSSFGRANGQIGNRDNTWQVDEQLSLSLGSHNLAFGAQVRYRRGWHLNGNSIALGVLSFQPAFTAALSANAQGQIAPAANTGDSFADFLLGHPVSGLLAGLPTVSFRSWQVQPSFQDTWRITRDLTLNYGVSWFLETPPATQGAMRDVVHGFDFSSGLLKYAGLGEIDPQPIATDRNNIAPRLGITWRPKWLPETVLRAGAGTYYSEFPWMFAAYPLVAGSPIAGGQSFNNPLTNPVPTYSLGSNVFPSIASASLTPGYAAGLPQGAQISSLATNFRTNYANQWNASIQHSLSRNDFLDITYIGSSAHRLPNLVDRNQCRPAADLFCDPTTKPWPRYGLFLYVDSTGNSSYHALLTKYERRAGAGLNLRFEYAFAKALSDTWQAQLSSSNQIATCRACSKGPATFDVRHRAVGSAIWTIPLRRGVFGNWTVSAIATFASGQPVNFRGPNQTGSPFISHLPNRTCDGRSAALSGSLRDNGFRWFDTSCFRVPAVGYFGNSSATALYGPGSNNWDIGIEKTFPIRDAVRLQVRGEMFNAFNHAQFLSPNGDAGAGDNFGRVSSTRPPRLVQLAAKLLW